MPSPTTITTDEHKTLRETRDDLVRLARHSHQLDNSIWIAPGSGHGSGTLSSVQARDAWSLGDGSSTGPSFSFYLPEIWMDRNAHIVWYLSEASADAGNFRINTRVQMFVDLGGSTLPGTASLNESVTTAAGSATVPLSVTTSSFTIDGRHFSVRFQRIGADAEDTATVSLILFGGLLVSE